MVPILLNAAASVAGNVIDSISEKFSHRHGVKKTASTAEDDFDAELAQAQSATGAAPTTGTSVAVPTTPSTDTQSALVSQLLGAPEVSTALAGANPSQPVQVEMTAAGAVSLRSANGQLQALKVSDHTRNLVSQLYSVHQSAGVSAKAGPVAVLAVDPANTAAASWSKLPPRTA